MGLNLSEVCCLFCCPPCQLSKIHNKICFSTLDPTYAIKTNGELELKEEAGWQYEEREKENIKVFYTRTSRGNRIACMHVKCSPNPRFTILFSHGNKEDLGTDCSFFLGLGRRINCNIFSYDYSGYGLSLGKPSEKNMYADIEAAWNKLLAKFGVRSENVILFGKSFGCGPTIDLASKMEVGGVILQTPIMSALGVFSNTQTKGVFKLFDAFNNIDKVKRVSSPVLVIHGTEDEIVDFTHGQAIYEACANAVEPLWVEGAGQNDLELYRQYPDRLETFISSDLGKE